MATEIATVSCSRCGNPMHLPAHVADLPADERLCGACTAAMVAVCGKCGIELIVGETWYPSRARCHSYICIECKKAYNRQYRREHLEERRAHDRQCYAANRQEKLMYSCQWRVQNQDYFRQYNKEHHQEQLDQARRRRGENPSRAREKSSRYRALRLGATVEPIDEQKIYELYNRTCIYCGSANRLELDHLVPLAGGGPHCEDNLVVACKSCNSSKRAKPLIEWLQTQPRARAWVA